MEHKYSFILKLMRHLNIDLFGRRFPKNPEGFMVPRQSAYFNSQAYLRSRLAPGIISLPSTTPDTDLLTWYNLNFEPIDYSSNSLPYQVMLSNQRPSINDRKYFGKNNEDVIGLSQRHTEVINQSTKNRQKRTTTDGRQVGFHQCYWNPVSCFRKR